MTASAIAIALVVMQSAADPAVTVRTVLDPPEIPFHRPAQFHIIVEAPDETEVKLPDMLEQFGGLGVTDIDRNTETIKGGRKRITETYTLDAVFAGNYPIAPVEVVYGLDEHIRVPSPGLRVRALTEEEIEEASQFSPNAGALTVRYPLERDWRLWAAIGAVAAVGLTLTLLLLWRTRRRARPVPPKPAWDVAYERLRELDQRNLPQGGKYEPFYVDLSAILRYYIEDRFRLHAPEQTTPEFLGEASGSGVISDSHQRIIGQFLRHCDLVKFAQYVPELKEMENSFELVLRFVEETVPQPEAQDEQEAAA